MSGNGIAILWLVRRRRMILGSRKPRFTHGDHRIGHVSGDLDDFARPHRLAWTGDEALQDQDLHGRRNEARHRGGFRR